jgi:hypothetical protein
MADMVATIGAMTADMAAMMAGILAAGILAADIPVADIPAEVILAEAMTAATVTTTIITKQHLPCPAKPGHGSFIAIDR